MRKYELPSFLAGIVTQAVYDKWLRAKSQAHFKRDKKRGNQAITNESYKIAIHRAVVDSKGFDEYTGETLDWKLIGKYNNIKSQRGKNRVHA